MTDDVHTLVGAYALDALDELDRVRVERHLGRCESCAHEAAELTATAARLADASAAVPPERLRREVLRAAARTRQLPPHTLQVTLAAPLRRRRLRMAVAVAAGILAFGTVAATYAVQEQRIHDAQVTADARRAETDRIASVLAAPDAVATTGTASDGGELVVVRSAALNAAVVTRVGMPALSPDRAYQLWLDVDGRMVDAGLMPEVSAVVEGIDIATRVAVSTEPAGGSERPTHPVGVVDLL